MNKKIIFFGIIALFLALVSPLSVFAAYESEQNIFIPQDRIIDYNLFKAGSTIDISGTLEKDAYVIGETVNIDGIIKGDLIGAASTLKINGEVNGNVRFVAENIIVNGKIGKNVNLAGSIITIGPEAEINWELLAAGNIIEVNGKVGANANLVGNKIVVNNEINGWFFANVEEGSLQLTEKAIINGNLEYISKNPVLASPGSVIAGETNQAMPEKSKGWRQDKIAVLSSQLSSMFFSLLGYLVVALLLLWLMPQFSEKVTDHIMKNFGLDFGIGFLLLIATPIACIIAAITIIGLPLALIAFVMYCVGLYLASIFTAIFLAKWGAQIFKLEKKKQNIWLLMIVGLIVLIILKNLPFIGWVFSLFALCVGLGGLFFVTKEEMK